MFLLSDGICMCLYPRSPEVCDRLPDPFPAEGGAGTQQSRGPEHQSGLLVHWGGIYPPGGQHQPGRPAQELLFRQENHNNPCWILTSASHYF